MKSDSSLASFAIQELILGLGSTSGRAQLIIVGDSIDPAPFRTKFQQVTNVPATPDAECINGLNRRYLANNDLGSQTAAGCCPVLTIHSLQIKYACRQSDWDRNFASDME